jgi:hypothetical protein
MDMVRRVRAVRRQRRPSVLLRNARWVAEARDIPALWGDWDCGGPENADMVGRTPWRQADMPTGE